MQVSEKEKILSAIQSEDELRKELVIPLLRKMSGIFTDVLDNQGPNEAGVDVIGVSTSPFRKPEYTAILLKKGDISLKAADRVNNIVNIVETQIRTALVHPLTHPRLLTDRAFANRVIVITNGNISRNAEDSLRKSFRERSDINMDFVGRDRLIESLDENWPEFYEDRRPFLSSYAKKLFDSLDTINFEVLGYADKKRSLKDIYIDSWLNETRDITSSDFSFEGTVIQAQKLCSQRSRLQVVTGGAGGGKSTLLKELAITESQNGSHRISVYLHARDLVHSVDVYQVAASNLAALSSEPMERVYEEIKDSSLLLLVDGMDELAAVDERVAVLEMVRTFALQRDHRAIVGTRPDSRPEVLAALTDFKSYSIAPLRYGQIRSFFGKWFGDSEKAANLLNAMRDKGVMDKLPRTPMTMTLVAIVFESKEELPANLTELYEMFVELLTGKWDSNRKILSPFDSQLKLGFLGLLAWTMQSERLDVMSQLRCRDIARAFLEHDATLVGTDPKEFVQAIIDRSQILVPTGADQIRFSHMTFQEFFCSQYIVRNDAERSAIVEWFADDWWSEVLFFYAGQKKNISKLVDDLLAADFDDPESRLTKLVTLGSMLQAGFLTKDHQKERAIDFASRRFMDCYEDLLNAVRTSGMSATKLRISRPLLIAMLQSLFSRNYTSKYLVKSLRKVYSDLMKEDHTTAPRFFIAHTLWQLRLQDELLEFATDAKMIDTSMYFLSETALSSSNSVTADKVRFKKLEKRKEMFIKAWSRERRNLLGKSPRPLAPGKKDFIPAK